MKRAANGRPSFVVGELVVKPSENQMDYIGLILVHGKRETVVFCHHSRTDYGSRFAGAFGTGCALGLK